MSRLQEKLNVFFGMAEDLAELSCCKVRKHGCLILPADLSAVLSIGYNGPARGEPDEACSGADGSACGCVHAEANALAKLRTERRGLILMCTKSPCLACAKLIANSGSVALVVFREEWSKAEQSLLVLMRARIGSTHVSSAWQLVDDLRKAQAAGRLLS